MNDAEKLAEIRKTAEASIARLAWDDEDEDEDDRPDDIYDRCGGNADDAYEMGEKAEELRMARYLMRILDR